MIYANSSSPNPNSLFLGITSHVPLLFASALEVWHKRFLTPSAFYSSGETPVIPSRKSKPVPVKGKPPFFVYRTYARTEWVPREKKPFVLVYDPVIIYKYEIFDSTGKRVAYLYASEDDAPILDGIETQYNVNGVDVIICNAVYIW